MSVYKAINSVQSELSRQGLAKNQTNSFDKYRFRGIDDVYNALAPLLAKHDLVILPRVISRLCDERQSKKGDLMLYVTVEVEFDFVSSEDGSKHTVKTFGEAMDRGDKATNKAMSAAYKYAAFQAFCIPTEGDNDSESETHQLPNVHDQYADMVADNQESIKAIKEGIANDDWSSAAEAWFELSDEVKRGLWKAPSNGGCFTTQERAVMQKAEFRKAFFGDE